MTPVPFRGHIRARSDTGQAGYTLIEVIIAVLLAGLVVLSLAAAMLTIVRTSARTAEREQVDSGLTSFAESLRATEYLPCDPTNPGIEVEYQSQYDAWPERWNPPSGMDATVVDVEHWDGSDYVAACAGTDRGAQRLTLEVVWRDTERQAHVVKRQR